MRHHSETEEFQKEGKARNQGAEGARTQEEMVFVLCVQKDQTSQPSGRKAAGSSRRRAMPFPTAELVSRGAASVAPGAHVRVD